MTTTYLHVPADRKHIPVLAIFCIFFILLISKQVKKQSPFDFDTVICFTSASIYLFISALTWYGSNDFSGNSAAVWMLCGLGMLLWCMTVWCRADTDGSITWPPSGLLHLTQRKVLTGGPQTPGWTGVPLQSAGVWNSRCWAHTHTHTLTRAHTHTLGRLWSMSVNLVLKLHFWKAACGWSPLGWMWNSGSYIF